MMIWRKIGRFLEWLRDVLLWLNSLGGMHTGRDYLLVEASKHH